MFGFIVIMYWFLLIHIRICVELSIPLEEMTGYALNYQKEVWMFHKTPSLYTAVMSSHFSDKLIGVICIYDI